jgi:Protein of unknown function (DUF3768)
MPPGRQSRFLVPPTVFPQKAMTARLWLAPSFPLPLTWGVTTDEGKRIMTDYNATNIACLNDHCRAAMGVAGRLFQTEGTNALPAAVQSAIRQQVETFTDFTADNDPYGERYFGAFEHNGTRIFWKIDYYAPDMQHCSEDPADPTQTVRVLTIMLASEY